MIFIDFRRTHCKLYVNVRVGKDGRRLDSQGVCAHPAPGQVGVSDPCGHQHILEICHPCFARSGRAIHGIKGLSIALDLSTRVGLEDAAELERSVVVLELRLEAGRIYHVRGWAESRNNVGGEESIIFGAEVLWVGGPLEEGSERVACGRIPECEAVFGAMRGLGWVRTIVAHTSRYCLRCRMCERHTEGGGR